MQGMSIKTELWVIIVEVVIDDKMEGDSRFGTKLN